MNKKYNNEYHENIINNIQKHNINNITKINNVKYIYIYILYNI